MKKRGQITIFIIIGIIILLVIAIIFFFQKQDVELRPQEPIEQKIGPVEQYIQLCVDELGEEAIRKMGQSGGYTSIPEELRIHPAANIAEDRLGLLKVPMWYYDDKSYMPSIEEMEFQIEKYLEDNMANCLDDFDALKAEYDITKLGEPQYHVTIAEENVAVETQYPLDVKLKASDDGYEVNKFSTIIPVRLRKAYSLARAIFEEENKKNFLENMTLQLMTMNPDVPFTGIEFRCSQKRWSINGIKDEILNAVASNIQRIRFKNTDHIPFLEPDEEYAKFKNLKISPKDGSILNLPNRERPLDLYEHSHFFFDVTSEDYSDIQVDTIFYREWPFNVDAFPSDGGVLRSEVMKGMEYVDFLCVEMWHFVYNVEFPLEFAIRDQQSFGGKGYTFKFAMPVRIVKNRALKLPLSEKTFIPPVVTGEPCENLGTEQIDIRVYDKVTKEELSRVNVSFDCLGFVCYLGQTKADSGINRLRTTVPSGCANAKLIVKKEDYVDGTGFAPQRGSTNVPIIPLKKFGYNITKVLSLNLDQEGLAPDEVVLINLKNKEYNYDENVVYPDITGGNLSQLYLIYDDITYDVEIYLSKGDKFTGGWTGTWKTTASDLVESNFIYFKVYQKIPYPSTEEEIVNMLDEVNTESSKYHHTFTVKNE